jgi:hypothetical protein
MLDWVVVAAGVEVATALVLIIRPSLCAWLLFGAEFLAPGQALGRLAGFALLPLAMACWPPANGQSRAPRGAIALLFFQRSDGDLSRLSGGRPATGGTAAAACGRCSFNFRDPAGSPTVA